MRAEEKLRRGGFALLATPLVVATGWRIARLDRRLGFESLLARLRAGSERPLPRWLARPEALAETVEKLLGVLPPRRYGVCLRRALVLFGLWSRCGLRPTLHLGFRLQAPERDGHAWLTARARDGSPLQVSGPLDFAPTFEV